MIGIWLITRALCGTFQIVDPDPQCQSAWGRRMLYAQGNNLLQATGEFTESWLSGSENPGYTYLAATRLLITDKFLLVKNRQRECTDEELLNRGAKNFDCCPCLLILRIVETQEVLFIVWRRDKLTDEETEELCSWYYFIGFRPFS